jgi:glycerophosphoryl diester phosphodiesterase
VSDQPVLAIAHRAGNSLVGLRAALEVGADVIEADVHHHRGNLEVRHLKTAGPLPFLWDRWELVRASAPRLGLAELLVAAERGTTFMLDLKGRRTAAAEAVARLMHEQGHHHDVIVCGRHWPSVEAMAHLPWVRPVLSARNRVELGRLRERVRAGRSPYGVSVHRSLLDKRIVDELHESVRVVMTWAVNNVPALDDVLDLGVSGVISDETSVLKELIDRRARSQS